MTSSIVLNNGQTVLVDEDLFDALNKYPWRYYKPRTVAYAVRSVTVNRKSMTLLMHREIMKLKGFHSPQKVDHRDFNGLNNQFCNLRYATDTESSCNRRKPRNNTTGYVGIYWREDRKRWRAQVGFNGKGKYIGEFKNILDAVKARDEYVIKCHGEFAVLNEEKHN